MPKRYGINVYVRWMLALGLAPLAGGWAAAVDAPSDAAGIVEVVRPNLDVCADRFLGHVTFLAHDELKGRGTGSNGIDLAAGYMAGQFAAAGIEPGGPGGTYLQHFPVVGGKVLEATFLTMDGRDEPAELGEQYNPFGFSAEGDYAGDAVFVGYGITDSDRGHDDYADIDVEGKVVVMLRREPPDWSDGAGPTNNASFATKVGLAAEHGASAVMIVNQDPGRNGVDGLMRFRGGGDPEAVPALHVRRALVDEWLASAEMPSLFALQWFLDRGYGPVSTPIPGIRCTGHVAYEKIIGRNVIGVLPGTGPNKDEHVVIGAHYDHLGENPRGIHNGADDNASGTAGVIELARAMAAQPKRDRSMIFMGFSGEEMGLLGSRYYVDHPTVPVDSIVAMLNMDMIGRHDPESDMNRLAIQGLGTGDSYKDIVTGYTQAAGMEYDGDDSALGPSDHSSFYRAGVPSLFFFTGLHSDYHRPGDDTEKVNIAGAVEIATLVGELALDIANAPERPVYAEVNQRANIGRGRSRASSSGGVVMGILPDQDDESGEKGWRIARVMPDGGAAQAGMQDGDRILRIGGKEVNTFSDYREAVGDKKPGDVVEVAVKRGADEVNLKVTLAARGG